MSTATINAHRFDAPTDEATGALLLRTDTELTLKSRRVVPGRLLEAGFSFKHPTWEAAARDLVERFNAKTSQASKI